MERHDVIRATSKGQVTLPASARRELGIKKGTRLLVTHRGSELTLRPVVPLSATLGVDRVALAKVRLEDLDKLRREWDKEFRRRLGERA